MTLIDWITIGIVLGFAVLGYVLGFGKGIKFFTSGVFGFIISLIVTIAFYNSLFGLSFVNELQVRFETMLQEKDTAFTNFLLTIPTYKILVAVCFFIFVQIVRAIVVLIVKAIAEAKTPVMKVLNHVFGIVLFLGALLVLVGVGFQIIHWIGGDTEMKVVTYLEQSALKLDNVYKFITGQLDTWISQYGS